MSEMRTSTLGNVSASELADMTAGLPPLPDIHRDLFARMQDPEVTVPQVAEIIAQNPKLASRILHVLNNALAAPGQPMGTIGRAVVVLGFGAVRSAALAVGIFDYFRDEESTAALDLPTFWSHSIGVASVAKVLAASTGDPRPEEPFVVGLLHDVGKLVVKRHFPADHDALVTKVRDEGCTWLAAENELLAVDHGVVAGALFRAWQLPPHVTESITHHHRPLATQDWAQLTALLHLADFAAYELDIGGSEAHPPGQLDLDAIKLLNITLPVSTEIEEKIRGEVERALAILDIII